MFTPIAVALRDLTDSGPLRFQRTRGLSAPARCAAGPGAGASAARRAAQRVARRRWVDLFSCFAAHDTRWNSFPAFLPHFQSAISSGALRLCFLSFSLDSKLTYPR